MTKKTFIALCMLWSTGLLFAQNHIWKEASSGGYKYRYVTNDPMQARFYTLKNGLTVILSKNEIEPRITSWIVVRTGSNNDPENHTGLAHYLEHMLFKGNQHFGTQNWAKEKPYIDKIYSLYDEYNAIPLSDTLARKAKYHEIDSVSGLASKISIANEYDKLMSTIGSQGTNAFTSVEQTVYVEDIPSNALDKYLQVQADRFRDPVFRIFHTELEAVYEEKNRSLDNDGDKVFESLLANLFPQSHYGTQTTIGTIEHLKNPSLSAIRKYYNEYYVPNNMAIVMSGDFDFDKTVKAIDKAFAYMVPKPVNQYKSGEQAPITAPIITNVTGPNAENLMIGYRLGPAGTQEALMGDLMATILSNGKAGLFDLNLNKKQVLQGAGASTLNFRDNGIFLLYAGPKDGQTLESVKDLLMQEIDKLKKGDFKESLLKAIIANYKLNQLKGLDKNNNRVSSLADEFIFSKSTGWDKSVASLELLSKITKEDVVKFANQFFGDNYTVIYKRKGENDNKQKVEKPAITPIETNAGINSTYVENFKKMPPAPTQPQWIDFNTALKKGKVGNAEILYVQNKKNDLFSLKYSFEMGSYNNKLLGLALQYASFVGTDKYSAADISTMFYDMACSFSAGASGENTTITISGLGENKDKAIALVEDIFRNCKADENVLNLLKNRLTKSRKDAKLNKSIIASALMSYATYGKENPFNYTLSDEELKNLKAEDLVNILHNIFNYEHRILFYGKEPLKVFENKIKAAHILPATWASMPNKKEFKQQATKETQVLFANYDMVQAEVYWNRVLDKYSPNEELMAKIFNNYFGMGMGTVVFQTIRESKALAYSTYAAVRTPRKQNENFGYVSYVGTQADKFMDATNAMNDLIKTLPENKESFSNAISSFKKDIETERITDEGIIGMYLSLQRKGINYDIRKQWYNNVDKITMKDLIRYHDEKLTNKPYIYTIVASEDKLPLSKISAFGTVKKLSLEELFGY